MGVDTSATLIYGTIVDVEDLTPAAVRQIAAGFSLAFDPTEYDADDDEHGCYEIRALVTLMDELNDVLRRRGLVVEVCGSYASPRWVIGRRIAEAWGDGESLDVTSLARITAGTRLSKRHRAALERLRRIIPGASPTRLVLSVMLTAP